MASLISDTEKNNLTGIFGDIFDTFKRTIVIHKEPKRVVGTINTASLFGYGDPAESVNYTYHATQLILQGKYAKFYK